LSKVGGGRVRVAATHLWPVPGLRLSRSSGARDTNNTITAEREREREKTVESRCSSSSSAEQVTTPEDDARWRLVMTTFRAVRSSSSKWWWCCAAEFLLFSRLQRYRWYSVPACDRHCSLGRRWWWHVSVRPWCRTSVPSVYHPGEAELFFTVLYGFFTYAARLRSAHPLIKISFSRRAMTYVV